MASGPCISQTNTREAIRRAVAPATPEDPARIPGPPGPGQRQELATPSVLLPR